MTYAATVLADSPFGYWRLGEASGTVAADSSGNGRNGTYAGTYTLGAAGLITGDTDTALSLNGAGYVDLGSFNFSITAASVEAWIKPTGYFTGGTYDISDIVGHDGATINTPSDPISGFKIRLGADTTVANENMVEVFTGDGVSYYVADSTGSLGWQVGQVAWGSGGVRAAVGVRHHVVGVYDGTGTTKTLTLYVDGVAIKRVISGTMSANGLFRIGASNVSLTDPAWTRWFYGTIDEVALYTTVLSPSRVLAHYQAGV